MTQDNCGTAPPPRRSGRRGYLDWIRGIAVLIMIEAHVIDSWTANVDRRTHAFANSMILGGFGAPLFLLLAGVAVSMSAGSKARRSGDPAAASAQVVRRGLEIFLLAFLFRIQAWILGWAAPWTLLRVDILNIMGPSIMAAAAHWGAVRSPRARVAAFTTATLATTLVTPLVRQWPALSVLPDPIEAYLRPTGALTSFAVLPWAGFVFAGALLGVLLDEARTVEQEWRLNLAFGLTGLLLAVGAYAASFLPTPYARSDFWTTSPSFFLLRLGVMAMAIAVAYTWERGPSGRASWNPLQQLGRTSLFIYWIHVEMVYGLVSLRIHHALRLPAAWAAFALFSVFMLCCSIWKDRLVAWWRSRRGPVGTPSAAGAA
jgi:uncharacterized membrane protein